MTDNNQRVNQQDDDTQVACDAFLAWRQSRGPLGPGAISERIFFAGWHAGKRHAAIEQAAPEAPAAAAAAASVNTWQRITAPGQVRAGDKLRFTIGDSKYNETVKLVLDAGTDREELIYNRRMNYYVITKNAMTGFGSSKNVEFLPKDARQSTKDGR